VVVDHVDGRLELQVVEEVGGVQRVGHLGKHLPDALARRHLDGRQEACGGAARPRADDGDVVAPGVQPLGEPVDHRLDAAIALRWDRVPGWCHDRDAQR